MTGTIKVPLGPAYGKPITDVTVAVLEAACDSVDAKLCEVTKGSDRSKSLKVFVNAARKLLHRRKFPTGTYTTTDEANRALRDAAEVGWLLSPSQQMAALLDGCALVITAFRADVQLDTFADDDEPGRRVPGKSLIDRVARELGISWLPEHCKRTDNQRSPHVRSYQAGGKIREFDLSWRQIQANAEVDLTAGSALEQKILKKLGVQRGRLDVERRRAFITSHADTSARLRAVRGLGLRDTYLPSELGRPFFCARVMFDGKSDNPATQAVFDKAVAEAFVPSANALFGGPKRAAGDR